MAEAEAEELPPIVMISEAQFVEQQLEPAYAQFTEEPTLDKAKTKKLMEDTINRGPIPDEDFNPWFDQMPKAVEDAEPLDVYNAKECVVLFAISIKMVPTREETEAAKIAEEEAALAAEKAAHIEDYKQHLITVEEYANPERQLYDFFKNDCLADVTLIHPTTGALYRVHRVIIASGSRYMLQAFTKHTAEQLPSVRCPEPFNQKNELHSDDQVSRIIKYIYGNQNIGVIRDEINEENFYSLYAQAFAMGCERLMEDLRELAISSLLNERSVIKLYLDAVEHKDTKIMEACTVVLTERFEEILARDETDIENLLELGVVDFISLLKADNLNLLHEEGIVELVRKYIAIRDLVPNKATSAEEQTKPELWSLLTEEEKENRKTSFQDQLDKEEAARAESFEKDADVYFAKDEPNQIQHVLDVTQQQKNLKIKHQSEKTKLSDEQKSDIFKCIRYQYLPQDILLKLSTDTDFVLGKDLIVQGLAIKLGGQAQFQQDDLKINLKARDAMQASFVNDIGHQGEEILEEGQAHHNESQMQMNPLMQNHMQGQQYGTNLNTAVTPQSTNKPNVGRDIFKNMNASGNNFYQSNNDNRYVSQRSDRPHSGLSTSHPRAASPNSRQKLVQQNVYANQANQRFNQVYQNQLNFQPSHEISPMNTIAAKSMNPRHQSLAAKMLDDTFARNENTLTGLPFANTMQKHQLSAKPPQRMQQQLPPLEPAEFNFEYNFDENGVLYYLGSMAKRRNWQNPHSIGQVQAFASSVGQGCSVENFVGRTVQNCRTEDEPYSFFGVDLGMERRLVPTHYTLRNRKSTTHVLRNWYLEGSVSGSDWTILDARIYNSDSEQQNAVLENEFKVLQKPGGAMTFQIDTEIYRMLGMEGFRLFRIVQVGKNTNQTDHLALSGFELYGRVSGGPWQFQ